MNKFFTFMLGASLGSLITWKLIEKKYKKLADEEIESVVKRFKEKEENIEDENSYKKILNDLGYDKSEEYMCEDDTKYIDPELEEQKDNIAPYVISPDEFRDCDNYDSKTWIYYADHTLLDEDEEIVVDPELIIGDALEHFGEYDDECVHVRNENEKCDYEILLSDKTIIDMEGN